MNGIKILSVLTLLSLGLSAFRTPASSQPDANAKEVFEYLTIVNPDGSAEFGYILKISSAQIQALRSVSGFSESAICKDFFKPVENSVLQFKQEQHGEDIWCTFAKTFDDLQGLQTQIEDDFNGLAVRRLEIRGGTFYLDLSWSAFPCMTTDTSQFSCEWAIQMPGKVGSNNATTAEGSTLIWDMSAAGTSHHFTAQSGVGNGFLGMDPTVIAVLIFVMCSCCLVLLLVGGGIAAFLIMRKRKPAPAASEPSTAPAAVGEAGPFPQL